MTPAQQLRVARAFLRGPLTRARLDALCAPYDAKLPPARPVPKSRREAVARRYEREAMRWRGGR